MAVSCDHADQIQVTETGEHACKACLESGQKWVKLRMCLTCGNVGCCDSSPGRHATRHFEETGHALMRSAEPGEAWVWCYVDEKMVGEIDA